MTKPTNEATPPTGEHDSEHHPIGRRRGRLSFANRLRAYFLAGIIVVAPIGITIFIVWHVVRYFDRTAAILLPAAYNPSTYLPFSVPGIGLILMIGLVILIGWFTASLLGRTLMRTGERLVDRMPIVRTIYSTLKQIFETVLAHSSSSFREVVLVEYPRRDMWAIAFVTGRSEADFGDPEDEYVNVFLPSTPNPTTGFLLIVPVRDLVHLDVPVEEGMQMIISGGIVNRPLRARRTEPVPASRNLAPVDST